jgi:hypothetical protein
VRAQLSTARAGYELADAVRELQDRTFRRTDLCGPGRVPQVCVGAMVHDAQVGETQSGADASVVFGGALLYCSSHLVFAISLGWRVLAHALAIFMFVANGSDHFGDIIVQPVHAAGIARRDRSAARILHRQSQQASQD